MLRRTDLVLDRARLVREVSDLQSFSSAEGVVGAKLAVAPPAAVSITRKDQATLAPAEAQAFKNAVRRLVDTGAYGEIVATHSDMSHHMHGSMHGQVDTMGLLRFLPWHRRFLQLFEEALRSADKALRPQATELIGVPYWRWPDPFPAWLDGFLPARLPDGSVAPPRTLAPPPSKPTLADLGLIVIGFGKQLAGQQAPDYVRFTVGLEGWGVRPDGTSLPAHNHVHDWVGGVMSDPMLSPVDPVFWLHHAEVDRLWAIWQIQHPNALAPLAGDNRILDPWSESILDVNDSANLGYKYASVVP